MSDETTLQAAYLLHYTPWRDTSFIVDLFTLGHGRLGLVARGARSAKPRTRALYQPFRPLLVSWFGGGELRTLTGIEESGAALPLAGASLASGYYVNELVLRLLGKEQPQPELFAHYALALAELADTGPDASVEATLRRFELQLLETVGVLPDLARCTPDGRDVEPERRYRFLPASALAVPMSDRAGENGGAGLALPKRPAGDAVAELDVHPDGVTREAGIEVGGRTLLDMAALDFGRALTREEAKPLTRRLVAAQLGGRPLRSRSLFAALAPSPSTGAADETGRTGECASERQEATSTGGAGADRRAGGGAAVTGGDGENERSARDATDRPKSDGSADRGSEDVESADGRSAAGGSEDDRPANATRSGDDVTERRMGGPS